MQIELLETFLDLVETRSFNRTAERLGVTQSTVSGRVQALEAAVGARLFTRSRAGTDITTEGLKFLTHARSLRHEWTEALRQVRGTAALSVRIGIQNDLVPGHIGDLLADFRESLPETVFYIEPDYSAQMCADLTTGALDFAVMFSPKPLPDLHFASVGEVVYRLISSEGTLRRSLDPARYVLAHFSPAFERAHRQLLPELNEATITVGQSAAVAALLNRVGGAGFIMAGTAAEMVASGGFAYVSDVPPLPQPVFAASHIRHRIAPVQRRLSRIVQRSLSTGR